MYVEPPRPHSLFLEHGSAAKTLISHPHNTASYATQAMLSHVRSCLSRQQEPARPGEVAPSQSPTTYASVTWRFTSRTRSETTEGRAMVGFGVVLLFAFTDFFAVK